MLEKRARDLLIPIDEYPSVQPECTLREAMAILDAPRFDIVASSGRLSLPWVLLVVDEQQALLGMLRRRDIIRGLGPGHLRGASTGGRKQLFPVEFDPLLTELSRPGVATRVREHANRPVRDVMLPIRATVDHDDHLGKVIERMVVDDVSVVPVLEHGRVAGVVSSVDVFFEVSRIVLGTDEAP